MQEHIKIGDVAPRVQYIADGVLKVFPFPFPIFRAGDLELRLDGVVQASGYAVDGAGNSSGGTLTLALTPAAGTVVTLRRHLTVARTSDFQDNGVLRAATLNDELDFQTAALQEVTAALASTLRLNPAEIGADMQLPLRSVRANRLLGFDSAGDISVFNPGETTLTLPFPGGVPRTVEDKLDERLSARDFGATGDGATDDGPALQAAMNAAAAAGKHLVIGEGSFRTTMPLTLGGAAAGLTMLGSIRFAGAPGQPALTLGDGNAVRNAGKLYQGLRVLRATQSDWSDEADIGILLRNLDSSLVQVHEASGFTIGLRTVGEEHGFQDNTLLLGRLLHNRIGLDVHTLTAAGWNTSNRYVGGKFAVGSSVNTSQDRFGVRLSAAPGAYVAHNRHVFTAPNFQLQARDRPIAGIPFLSEVDSRAIIAQAIRMEGCSPFVARHTAGAQDHVYEVAWASQGYHLDIDYAPTATRVGAVLRTLHQAAAHREMTRQVLAIPNLRAGAFRWSNSETGFEKLACLSTNVSGAPSSLADFAFGGLDDYTLTDRGVLLTGGRGLGIVVDTRSCKEFALALDADDPRLVVQCFDAEMALLTNAGGELVRASGMSLQYAATPRWWQAAADMTDAELTRLQVVRLAPPVAYAIIGAARITRDYELRAMRLACDPRHAPAVLYGLPGLPHGSRELRAQQDWNPGSIAAGASAQVNIALDGARPGDFAQAAFSLATSGCVFLAQIGATNLVTVTAWNRSGMAIDLNPGTVRVRVVKA